MSGPDLGRAFAEALAAKDTEALTTLLAPDIDFRALTPRKFWEAETPGGVLEVLFGTWFEDDDHIDELLTVASGQPVGDTEHVSYRLAITNADGPHLVEQQAYFRPDGDRIAYLRVLCSGYRPAGG